MISHHHHHHLGSTPSQSTSHHNTTNHLKIMAKDQQLKELPRALMVSCREWDWLSSRDDSFAIIPLCPNASTGSSGYHRTELALLISLSSVFLSAVEMLLPQQTTPKKMADATRESCHPPAI
ncbi:unnamed protein product [Pleuronectes platessa]|uniref:Uncharacterized protein n=1 Tax=Pleuronectes platessa TaxID=8262 RepID=A0A9N7TNU8_PLEPL|nr:unnamed protein product [Pleuronectes platessa]